MFPAVKPIFYPLIHAAAIVVVYLSMRVRLRGDVERPHRLALGVTALYLFSHGVMSKIFHFGFKADEVPPLVSFVNPIFYFKPGFWGWMLAFLPLAFAFPFLCKLDRQVFYRAIALTLPLVIALQKLACFVSGCCAGAPTDLPWAVVFPTGSSARLENVPVHPTQIYDLLLALSWFAILTILDKQERFRPYLFPLFLVLYGISRFSTEPLRPEASLGLSASQTIEIVLVMTVVVGLVFDRKTWLRVLGKSAAICPDS